MNSETKQPIYEFLHNKRYDESLFWPNMLITFKDGIIDAKYTDGTYKTLNQFPNPLTIILEDLEYKSRRNKNLLKDLLELFPEEFI